MKNRTYTYILSSSLITKTTTVREIEGKYWCFIDSLIEIEMNPNYYRTPRLMKSHHRIYEWMKEYFPELMI
jgi:hypothetical protein